MRDLFVRKILTSQGVYGAKIIRRSKMEVRCTHQEDVC